MGCILGVGAKGVRRFDTSPAGKAEGGTSEKLKLGEHRENLRLGKLKAECAGVKSNGLEGESPSMAVPAGPTLQFS